MDLERPKNKKTRPVGNREGCTAVRSFEQELDALNKNKLVSTVEEEQAAFMVRHKQTVKSNNVESPTPM